MKPARRVEARLHRDRLGARIDRTSPLADRLVAREPVARPEAAVLDPDRDGPVPARPAVRPAQRRVEPGRPAPLLMRLARTKDTLSPARTTRAPVPSRRAEAPAPPPPREAPVAAGRDERAASPRPTFEALHPAPPPRGLDARAAWVRGDV